MIIEFESIKEMVNYLIDNEGDIIADAYGRRWKFEDYQFYFRDVGTFSEYEQTLTCLHLYKTDLQIIKKEKNNG